MNIQRSFICRTPKQMKNEKATHLAFPPVSFPIDEWPAGLRGICWQCSLRLTKHRMWANRATWKWNKVSTSPLNRTTDVNYPQFWENGVRAENQLSFKVHTHRLCWRKAECHVDHNVVRAGSKLISGFKALIKGMLLSNGCRCGTVKGPCSLPQGAGGGVGD